MVQKRVKVTIENLAPEQGSLLTPIWAGFHNGEFDIYDRGRPASPGLESLAEDGNTTLISQEFLQSGDGSLDITIAGPNGVAPGPIDPGEITSTTVTLDSENPNSQYFSFASMVLPSNDAFVANGNPEAIKIFDDEGNFIGADFIVAGNQVLDAGTEVNDEAENSTAFLGQSEPNTGVDENGVVRSHPGLIEGGRILSADDFASADFTDPGYQLARITISPDDEPLPSDENVEILETEEFPDAAIGEEPVVIDNNSEPDPADLVEVTVTVENLAPENGTLLTPLWVGFHDGSFDTYDRGRPASAGLESLAEDGNTSLISSEFISSGAGTVDGTITAPGGATPGPIDTGETTSLTFTLDRSLASSRFFNYAAMVLPSNDAFIANGNPEAFEIFDENGNFLGADFVVRGNQVLDAGTEVNDEAENSTAFFGQSTPNTGTDENGVVTIHPGFEDGGRILSEPRFANADFTADGYEVARITITTTDVEQVPLGTRFQDDAQGDPLLDFRSVVNQNIKVSNIDITSEAAFDNTVGFYRIEDTSGTIQDEFGNTLNPGDDGYAEAAVRQTVLSLDRNTTDISNFAGGNILAPFVIANGTTQEFLNQNPNNQGGEEPIAYFSFLGANPDGVEHIRLLDNNNFAFEDLFGGGDNDFDDLIFGANYEVA
ncbi:MAG: spondin domain-containing protein [Cyanobacteria bacterium J06639_18]